jgi:putative endonuclease
MQEREYFTYILTNHTNRVLYIGVTGDLVSHMEQHRQGIGSVFTSKYNVTKLVYAEIYPTAYDAISREKQLKAGSRKKKIDLIETSNPDWNDLSADL